MAQFFNSNNRCNQMPCSGYAQQPAYYQEPTYCAPQNCMPQNCIPAEMAMPKTLDQKLHLAPGQPTATKDFILKCSNLNEDGSLTFDLKIDSKFQNLFFNSVNDRGTSWTASPTNMNFNDYEGTSSENKSWEINTFINPQDNSWRNVVVTLKEGTDAFRISAGNQTFVINREEIIDAIMAETRQDQAPPPSQARPLPDAEPSEETPPLTIPRELPEAPAEVDEDPGMFEPDPVVNDESKARLLPSFEPDQEDVTDSTPGPRPLPDAPPSEQSELDPFNPYTYPSGGFDLGDGSFPPIPQTVAPESSGVARELPPAPEPADPFRGGTSEVEKTADELQAYARQANELYNKIHGEGESKVPTYEIIAHIKQLSEDKKSHICSAYKALIVNPKSVSFEADLIRTRKEITADEIEKLVEATRVVTPQANKLAKDLYVEMNEGLTTYNQSVLKLIADNTKYAGEAAKLYQDFYGHKVNIIYEAAKNNNQIQRDLKAVLSDVEYGAVASYFNMDKFSKTDVAFSPASYAQQLYDCFPKYWKNNQELFVSMVGALKTDESKYNAVNDEFKKLDGKNLEEFAKGYTFTSEQNAILNAPAVKVAQ